MAIFSLLAISCSSSKEVLSVAPDQSIELEFPEYESYEARVSNKSMKDVEVKVLDSESQEQVSGFGLAKKNSADVMVNNSNKLVIKNTGDKTAKVVVGVKNQKIAKNQTTRSYVSFTLRNNSAKSIPLIIPTVMNPNLSPFSNSGVDLKIGQEIIFKNNGRKYVLLTVSEEIQDGDILLVDKLLKEKKKELGI